MRLVYQIYFKNGEKAMSENQMAEKAKNMDPFWKCEKCGNTIQLQSPPERCPSCNEKCKFKDVSCYTPDCGGPGNIDPQL